MGKELYKTLIEHLKKKIVDDETFKKDDLESVLSKGYFPAKLPPCFSTKAFGKLASNHTEKLLDIIYNKTRNEILTIPTSYYLARHNQIRRILGVLNPMSYFLISCVFCVYKKEILKKAQSKFSLSSPIVDNDTSPNARAYKQEIAWEDSDVVRLENRAGKMVVLKTDISRFYPSIYTHIIPWVVEGKIEAKKDRSNINKLGNMLDKTFEWSQDGQTFGLPIGPDISFIIAEVILSHIDNLIDDALKKNGCGNICWIRRVDDCEFACNNKEQANKALAIIQSILNDFELELNNHKTEIIYLPTSVTNEEIQKICEYELASNEKNRKRILNYFEAFKNNTKGVLKYAVKSIKIESLMGDFKELFINFICQCMVLEEGVSESALIKFAILLKDDVLSNKSKEKIKNTLYAILSNHSERKHTSEVVWALWGFFLLEENISDECTEKLCNMEDTFVYIMLLDFASKGYANKEKIIKNVSKFISKNKDNFIGSHWLILYELMKNEWFDVSKYKEILEKDTFFKFLYDNDISFYRSEDSSAKYIEIFENWLEDNYGCSVPSQTEQDLLNELLYKDI